MVKYTFNIKEVNYSNQFKKPASEIDNFLHFPLNIWSHLIRSRKTIFPFSLDRANAPKDFQWYFFSQMAPRSYFPWSGLALQV